METKLLPNELRAQFANAYRYLAITITQQGLQTGDFEILTSDERKKKSEAFTTLFIKFKRTESREHFERFAESNNWNYRYASGKDTPIFNWIILEINSLVIPESFFQEMKKAQQYIPQTPQQKEVIDDRLPNWIDELIKFHKKFMILGSFSFSEEVKSRDYAFFKYFDRKESQRVMTHLKKNGYDVIPSQDKEGGFFLSIGISGASMKDIVPMPERNLTTLFQKDRLRFLSWILKNLFGVNLKVAANVSEPGLSQRVCVSKEFSDEYLDFLRKIDAKHVSGGLGNGGKEACFFLSLCDDMDVFITENPTLSIKTVLDQFSKKTKKEINNFKNKKRNTMENESKSTLVRDALQRVQTKLGFLGIKKSNNHYEYQIEKDQYMTIVFTDAESFSKAKKSFVSASNRCYKEAVTDEDNKKILIDITLLFIKNKRQDETRADTGGDCKPKSSTDIVGFLESLSEAGYVIVKKEDLKEKDPQIQLTSVTINTKIGNIHIDDPARIVDYAFSVKKETREIKEVSLQELLLGR